MELKLIKKAVEGKYRFPSVRGGLSLEELYDLPLQGSNGLNLDEVAIKINSLIDKKEGAVKSFVRENKSRDKELKTLEEMLEIVKDRIEEVQERIDANEAAVAKASQKAFYEELLAKKEMESISNLSADEIRAKLAELEA